MSSEKEENLTNTDIPPFYYIENLAKIYRVQIVQNVCTAEHNLGIK